MTQLNELLEDDVKLNKIVEDMEEVRENEFQDMLKPCSES